MVCPRRPSASAKSVIVTGDFDKWSKSLHLTRSSSSDLFTATIKVPYGCPTRYKFIVDDEWTVKPGEPTELSPEGYLNNIYYVPLKPPPVAKPSADAPASPESAPRTNDTSGFDPADTSPGSSTSIAPIIPIPIVPVYAKENYTIDPAKVVPDEESIGTFVGLSPKPKDREARGGQDVPVVLPGIPVIVTPLGEEPAPVLSEVRKEEEPIVEVAAPVDKVEPSAAPVSAPAISSEPAEEEKAAVPAPAKKVDEPSSSTAAVLAESEPAPATKSTSNGHAQDPSSVSTKVASPRPTTPTSAAAPTDSVKSTPASTVRKLKIFPNLGKDTPSKSSTKGGGTDEFGLKDSKGTTSSKKKRTSSFFGTLKKIFHHDHDKDKEEEKSAH
ncbi:5'-AMP-activated protein kinase subunit beta-1 [Leucoagaricus sp. SymC.cos]|nr:5'-AMP-activated protein kinase subunit beta-1 [Leucoagaricus sp. SymC.cos]